MKNKKKLDLNKIVKTVLLILTSIFGCVNKSLTISALSLSTAIDKAVFVLDIF